MRIGDNQLGLPEVLYQGSRASIEALANPVTGMLAYDSTAGELVCYNGSKWVSAASGAGKLHSENVSSQFTTNPAHFTVTSEFETGTLMVYWNGVLQAPTDFTPDADRKGFTLGFTVQTGDVIEAVYQETSGIPYKTTGGRTYVENLTSQVPASHFALNNSFYLGTLAVYRNGLLQKPTDYTLDSDQHGFTLTTATVAGDEIVAVYQAGTALYDPTNADTVDGYHAKATGSDAHIPVTNPSGKLTVDGLTVPNIDGIDFLTITQTALAPTMFGTDKLLRLDTSGNLWLEGESNSDKLNPSASDLLTKVKTVDGSGSGLDADTLDGSHASAFAASGHNHTLDSLSNVQIQYLGSGDRLVWNGTKWANSPEPYVVYPGRWYPLPNYSYVEIAEVTLSGNDYGTGNVWIDLSATGIDYSAIAVTMAVYVRGSVAGNWVNFGPGPGGVASRQYHCGGSAYNATYHNITWGMSQINSSYPQKIFRTHFSGGGTVSYILRVTGYML